MCTVNWGGGGGDLHQNGDLTSRAAASIMIPMIHTVKQVAIGSFLVLYETTKLIDHYTTVDKTASRRGKYFDSVWLCVGMVQWLHALLHRIVKLGGGGKRNLTGAGARGE